MATNHSGLSISLPAAADLTSKQFTVVKLDSNGAAANAGAGEAGIGILQNNPNTGQPATVQIDGISKAKAGGSITAGAALAANAAGLLVAATTGNYIVGFAKTGAASGDVFPVVLKSLGKA
jgi:hypothetical protein